MNLNQHDRVRVCDKLVLNPMQERIIEIKIVDLPNCDTAQFIPTPHLLYQDSILLPHALIKVKNNKALMAVMNISNGIRTINKNTPIGIIEIEPPNSSCFLISTTTSSSSKQKNDNGNRRVIPWSRYHNYSELFQIALNFQSL
jgi:hypothetical protein